MFRYAEIEVTEEMVKWAKERTIAYNKRRKEHPEWFERFDEGLNVHDSPMVGHLGEAGFLDYYHQYGLAYVDSSGGDVRLPDGQCVDIKTAVSDGQPKAYWWAQMPEINKCRYTRQTLFFFARLTPDHKHLYLAGFIDFDLFYKIGQFGKEGTIRSEAEPFVYRADCTEVRFSQLYPYDELMKEALPQAFPHSEYPPCNVCNLYRFEGLKPYCKLKGQLISEKRWSLGCAGHIDRYAKALPK